MRAKLFLMFALGTRDSSCGRGGKFLTNHGYKSYWFFVSAWRLLIEWLNIVIMEAIAGKMTVFIEKLWWGLEEKLEIWSWKTLRWMRKNSVMLNKQIKSTGKMVEKQKVLVKIIEFSMKFWKQLKSSLKTEISLFKTVVDLFDWKIQTLEPHESSNPIQLQSKSLPETSLTLKPYNSFIFEVESSPNLTIALLT
jgi:hypothetical protein